MALLLKYDFHKSDGKGGIYAGYEDRSIHTIS